MLASTTLTMHVFAVDNICPSLAVQSPPTRTTNQAHPPNHPLSPPTKLPPFEPTHPDHPSRPPTKTTPFEPTHPDHPLRAHPPRPPSDPTHQDHPLSPPTVVSCRYASEFKMFLTISSSCWTLDCRMSSCTANCGYCARLLLPNLHWSSIAFVGLHTQSPDLTPDFGGPALFGS